MPQERSSNDEKGGLLPPEGGGRRVHLIVSKRASNILKIKRIAAGNTDLGRQLGLCAADRRD
jgi:hypothetical protein